MDVDKMRSAIAGRIEDDISAGRLYGAAAAVGDRSGTLADIALGVDRGAVFRLASMTKPVTAVAALIECSRGRLKLDDRVDRYLPAYAGMYVGRLENGRPLPDHRAVRPITLLHLLTHTSGLLTGDFSEVVFKQTDAHRTSLREATNYYPQTLLAFDPFTAQGYSALAAFDVAARIVELVSGMEFDRYLAENIFSPLGMTDTGFSASEERRKRFAPVHARRENGESYTAFFTGTMGSYPDSYFSAGGGLAGTLDDYAAFARMLLNGGEGIVPPEYIDMMRRPWWPGWGLGVRTLKNDRRLPDGCFGWSGAYGTHFWVDPGNGIYAVYMKNSLYDGGSGAKTAKDFEEAVMEGLR